MIKQVVFPRKSIAGLRAVAARVLTEVWLITVSMHCMRFSFMAEQTGCGGKVLFGARSVLAAKGFDVRIDVFTGQSKIGSAFLNQ